MERSTVKLKSYPKYKDSRVQWIGKIPEEWEVRKLKHIAKIYSGTDTKKDGKFPIYGANGIIGYCERPSFKKERVIIGRVGSSGEINLAKERYGVSDNALIVNNDDRGSNTKFLFYVLNCVDFSDDISFNAQPLLTATKVKEKIIQYPRIQEQTTITSFLDKKTTEIDDLIEKDKKLIELLKEKRAALINNAVTKGIDPNVKLKDSGIDWIGKIPEGWDISRLKNKTLIKYGSSLSELERSEGNINVFGSNGKIGKHNKSITKGKTIIIGRKGSHGKLNLSENSCFPIDTTYFIDNTCTKYDLKYLFYLITQLKLDETSRDSAVPGLSREIAYSKIIPYIPKSEQRAIAEYLDKQTLIIDKTIQKIEQKIRLLEEYKKSLIHHVVTGKIDVRGSGI